MKKNILMLYSISLIFLGCEKEGLDGKNSLLDLVIEQAGENCLSGGYKINSGIDLNDNNSLDEEEIQNTKYICNGIDGDNGKNSLLDIIPEPSGENCISGGYKVISGIDLNNNNSLDDEEVQNTKYICNGIDGENGTNSLLDIIPEPSGENCISGGYKIILGNDLNNNDILEGDEIQTTQYVCNGKNGTYDKKVIIPFIGGTGAYTSSSGGELAERDELIGFNISDYSKADSIVFGIYLVTTNEQAECIVELFDKTHNRSINNTRLTTRSETAVWTTTAINFIADLPNEPIDIGFKIKSGSSGITVGGLSPTLTIYKE